MSVSIEGDIKRTDGPLTSSVCSTCSRECSVGMFHAVKVFGEWKTWRECVDCFLEQEERAIKAIAVAERAGA